MQAPPKTLQVVAETATVSTRDVVTGKVRVETRTEIHDEFVSAAVRSENVTVERVSVNREVDVVPTIRTEGDVTIVPVVEEVIVVEKRLIVREELHIRRTVSSEIIETSVPLRKQSATIHRVDDLDHATEEEV